MAYTAWSVVFGEQPTAAKWNQLGANDAGFKDGTNIDDEAILNRHVADDSLKGTKMLQETSTAVSFAANWSSVANHEIRVTRKGGWAFLSGIAVKSTTYASSERILTLPVGYRPAAGIMDLNGYIIAQNGTTGTTGDLGTLNLYASDAAVNAGEIHTRNATASNGKYINLYSLAYPCEDY